MPKVIVYGEDDDGGVVSDGSSSACECMVKKRGQICACGKAVWAPKGQKYPKQCNDCKNGRHVHR